jgi:hypothetical protein
MSPCVSQSSELQISPDGAATAYKELPTPIRRSRLGAVYRLGSPEEQEPAKSEDAGKVDK